MMVIGIYEKKKEFNPRMCQRCFFLNVSEIFWVHLHPPKKSWRAATIFFGENLVFTVRLPKKINIQNLLAHQFLMIDEFDEYGM